MPIVIALMMSATALADLPVIEVENAGTEIRESARVKFAADIIRDEDGRGVIHIIGEDLVIEFGDAHLRGSPTDANPDTYSGIGVRITGENVRITGGQFSGFKVAIHARNADDLTIDGADISDNFRQRLRSTPEAEATEDWLWPHRNDANEWMHNYGAGLYIEDSDRVTVRNVVARNVQNGIILDRVNDSRIYDNDCSFLSGWGLAMWRSNRNTISRNAFDFCVRGYSHGVYNRGQDSAGILMFEQCSENLIVQNSATHGGDGLFGFAGLEALGEVNPREDLSWYHGRGNNHNRIVENDLSYAVAHGLEMTFSFENHIAGNRFNGNAICGIWGGVSQRFVIQNNVFENNGEMPYGLERGGVNIEHGVGHIIQHNTFESNACGVHLWDREENRYALSPWGVVNDPRSRDNEICRNRFHRDEVAVHLRRVGTTRVSGNIMDAVGEEVRSDEMSSASREITDRDHQPQTTPPPEPIGVTRPVGARANLAGRDRIIITEWGPYDWESLLFYLQERSADRHVYRLLGMTDRAMPIIDGEGIVSETIIRDDQLELRIAPRTDDAQWRSAVLPYTVRVEERDTEFTASGVVMSAKWMIRVFAWTTDPREDVEAWRQEAADGVAFTLPHLQLRYRHGGPSQLPHAPESVRNADLPTDQFGTIARTTLTFPPGRWRIRTVSDDGIRMWLDDEKVIDDWTWHAPTEHSHEFTTHAERKITILVEHFELDGYAVLTLDIEAIDE